MFRISNTATDATKSFFIEIFEKWIFEIAGLQAFVPNARQVLDSALGTSALQLPATQRSEICNVPRERGSVPR
jgi:hypothetical protein